MRAFPGRYNCGGNFFMDGARILFVCVFVCLIKRSMSGAHHSWSVALCSLLTMWSVTSHSPPHFRHHHGQHPCKTCDKCFSFPTLRLLCSDMPNPASGTRKVRNTVSPSPDRGRFWVWGQKSVGSPSLSCCCGHKAST